MPTIANNPQSGVDRPTITLPGQQEALIKAIKATGVKLVVVYINGGALSSPFTSANADALIQAFFGGQEAGEHNHPLALPLSLLTTAHTLGHAIVDVLTGAYNPGGRLPYTIQTSDAQLPPMTDYNMSGTTAHNLSHALTLIAIKQLRPILEGHTDTFNRLRCTLSGLGSVTPPSPTTNYN